MPHACLNKIVLLLIESHFPVIVICVSRRFQSSMFHIKALDDYKVAMTSIFLFFLLVGQRFV